MGRYESPGFVQLHADGQDSLLFSSLPGMALNLHALPLGDLQQAGNLRALLAPGAGAGHHHLLATALPQQQQLPAADFGSAWAAAPNLSLEPRFDTQLSYEDSRPAGLQPGRVEATLFKFGAHPHQHQLGAQNSRLGNLQYSSNGHGLPLPLPQHSSFPGKLPANVHNAPIGFCTVDSLSTVDSFGSSQQQWEEQRANSPYRASLIGSFRAQELRDSSASSSPFGSYSGSPRGVDFRTKRHSGSTNGVSSPRTPPHGSGAHRVGIDPRLVVGSPLEIAWEVLQQSPGLAALLNLAPGTAKLCNVAVQEDDEPEAPSDSTAAAREPELPLNPEQLVNEQGLVRSCRGLPARVRDDLIKAARLAVTRSDSSGRELPGTGLLPFFWRVQTNLKWLLQQPATLKGQLLPGQIDFITEEQRAQSFQKTVQQRVRLGQLAVMLHTMLQPPEAPAASSDAGASA